MCNPASFAQPAEKPDRSSNAEERLYVHSDKEIYTAGEIAWVRVYAIDALTHHPVNRSKVSYVEIIDINNKPVAQGKIEMNGDGGSGSFYLPLSIPTGNYTLRAYTNVMKRTGNQDFFEKIITIINTVKYVPPATVTPVETVTVQFFPEGGSLVAGLESLVAFKATDVKGTGVTGNGILISNTGDTILTATGVRYGMGSFRFTPAPGKSYKFYFTTPGAAPVITTLPASRATGLTVGLVEDPSGNLVARVQGIAGSANAQGENITLVVHDGRKTISAQQALLVYGREQIFPVEKAGFQPGLTHITLFNSLGQPVAERLYFTKPALQQHLRLTTTQPSFSLRSPVTLNMSFRSDDADTLLLSASVYRFDSLKNLSTENIITSVWLSGIPGHIEDPAFYLGNDAGVREATNLLMLTNGWRKFDTRISAEHPAEYNGHVITALVTDNNEQPVPNINCYLTVPSSPPGLFIARTDSKGYVRFTVKKYYGPGEIIVQPVSEDNRTFRVYVQTPFSTDPARKQVPVFQLTKDHERLLLQKNLAMQVQNIYTGDSIRRFNVPSSADTTAFYGKPEFSYWLEDYKRFTTMEEVLREYVVPVNVVMKNGRQKLRIYDELNKKLFENYMLVLLDGVPLKDPDKIFSYDPLKVRRIQVVPRGYLYGSAYFTGIASFETYNGRFDAFELDPTLVAIDYEGLQMKREFYSPTYATAAQQASRIPDMRTTLQWLPDLRLVNNIPGQAGFFTSDVPGSYVVVAEGVSVKGKLVSVVGSFEVK